MWSAPLKRTAPDGSEYSLLLLDSEGIDAYDQTVRSTSEAYCEIFLCCLRIRLSTICIDWKVGTFALSCFIYLRFAC